MNSTGLNISFSELKMTEYIPTIAELVFEYFHMREVSSVKKMHFLTDDTMSKKMITYLQNQITKIEDLRKGQTLL